MFIGVETFSKSLQDSGQDFICETDLPAVLARVLFVGEFQGQSVCWQMTLATLAHYQQLVTLENKEAGLQYCRCPFIQIAEGVKGVHEIKVGLALPEIDLPAVKKSIIMIRNYKRLRIGLIEFCPELT